MEQINGVEVSADGKRNAHTFPCSVVGYRPHFAVCLNLIAKRKEGRLSALYATCSAAIGNKRCPALSMRKEELERGVAIYFVERVRGEAVINPTAAPALKRYNKSSVINRTKPVENKMPGLVDGGGIADAINNALQEEKAEVADIEPGAIATQEPAIKPLPGESLLDMARRIMKLNKEKAK